MIEQWMLAAAIPVGAVTSRAEAAARSENSWRIALMRYNLPVPAVLTTTVGSCTF